MNNEKMRGRVHSPARMNQPINFKSLSIGKIVPCDIDLLCEARRKFCVEYHNKAWIFIEFKLRDTAFPLGQRLMHERLVDDLTKTGKPAISILAQHDVDDPTQEIDAAQCVVRQFYMQGQWRDYPYIKLKEFIGRFLAYIKKNGG